MDFFGKKTSDIMFAPSHYIKGLVTLIYLITSDANFDYLVKVTSGVLTIKF